ncbi:hypothetical protein [Hymenobacter rubidus]|uniref:hypothetical protein n=1 Tax=Hymenobacter rubidus TaxID=1441626 RepID=UPI0019202606|nr:hypothetical protein [Hymenobacter rubidus]
MSAINIPDYPRDPRLSAADLHQALDELDAKIKTLHSRAHATVAGSTNTYEAHATALEAKRARLAEQLRQAGSADANPEPSVWTSIRRSIAELGDEVRDAL